MGVPKHEMEWKEAQKIRISTDLILAAKQQLQFLRAVDNSSVCLYQGPALLHAIYRYKYCWLPLVAEFEVSNTSIKDPLAPPLDCEWVWHCHRLNPIRYKADCESLYGRILDSHNIVSSVNAEGASTRHTEEIWNKLYPLEPYSFNKGAALYQENSKRRTTDYDLESAVKRQSTFYQKVSRPEMSKEEYLKSALERYKGFLHLIKMNFTKHEFCVPTHDIDLIWHSHQLNSTSYVKDTVALFGKVLDHDDTDSDKGEDSKLAVGFHNTTKQWEETFGSRFCCTPPAHLNNSSQLSKFSCHGAGCGGCSGGGGCSNCRGGCSGGGCRDCRGGCRN